MNMIEGTIIELAAESTAGIVNHVDAIGKDLEKVVSKALDGVCVTVRNTCVDYSATRGVCGLIRVGGGDYVHFALDLNAAGPVLSIYRNGDRADRFIMSNHGFAEEIGKWYRRGEENDKRKAAWYGKVTDGAIDEVVEASERLVKVLKRHNLALVSNRDTSTFRVVPVGVTVDFCVEDEYVLDEGRFPEITIPVAGCFDTDDHVLVMPDEN